MVTLSIKIYFFNSLLLFSQDSLPHPKTSTHRFFYHPCRLPRIFFFHSHTIQWFFHASGLLCIHTHSIYSHSGTNRSINRFFSHSSTCLLSASCRLHKGLFPQPSLFLLN